MAGETILIVEDDGILAAHLQILLGDLGYTVPEPVASGERAIERIAAQRPDLVLMDIELAGNMNGIEAAAHIGAAFEIPVIYLTGYSQDSLLQQAKVTKPYGYLVKPVSERELVAAMEIAFYKQAVDRQLRESEQRFRTVADFTYDWEYWMAPDGKLLYVSPACERITGYSAREFVEDPELLMTITHPADRALLAAHLGRETVVEDAMESLEYRVISRQGQERWIGHECQWVFNAEGESLGRRASNRDITRRKLAEEKRLGAERQLQQAQKRLSLATMAGAVAHHFNNLLFVVKGNLDIVREELPPDSNVTAELMEAEKAVHRAAELSQLMLTCVGQSLGRRVPLDLVTVIQEMLPVMRSTLPGNVRLELDLLPGGPSIMLAPANARHVVSSLVTNAWEAMQGQEGIIRFAVGAVAKGEPFVGFNPAGDDPGEGPWVCLQVTDNGCGMDEETRSRMFDPFFSTKFTGRGLGLAVTLGIVLGCDGAIFVESEVRSGTTVRVFFPACEPLKCKEAARIR